MFASRFIKNCFSTIATIKTKPIPTTKRLLTRHRPDSTRAKRRFSLAHKKRYNAEHAQTIDLQYLTVINVGLTFINIIMH